jgi:hypothetical protein
MPKTLRRPMFRGGPVNSEGTGITTGLDQGYETGGRVGFKEGEGLFDFLDPYFGRDNSNSKFKMFGYDVPGTAAEFNEDGTPKYPPIKRDPSELLYLTGLGRLGGIGQGALKTAGKYPQVLDQYKRYVSGIKDPFIGAEQGGYNAMIPNVPSNITKPGMFTNTAISEAVAPYLSGAKELAKSGAGKVLDLAKEYGLAGGAAAGLGYGIYKGLGGGDNKNKPELTKGETEVDRLNKIIEEMKMTHEDQLSKLRGTGTGTGTAVSGESDVSQWAKEARDLLGYEDAKKQSIYDALLAASPGFFKGRNLKEAAPNVFESINKSGAFDKPTNIKQAAAQLAIQRKMLQEKAIAEEKTRYGLLEARDGLKSKDPIERLKALGGDPSISFEGTLPDNPKLLKPGKFYVDKQGKLVKIAIDEKTKLPYPINFG